MSTTLEQRLLQAAVATFTEGQERRPTIQQVQDFVANFYGITTETLNGRDRHDDVIVPRFIAITLAREFTRAGLARLGEKFGGRNHGSMLNAIRQTQDRREVDRYFRADFERLRNAMTTAVGSPT